MTSNTHVGSCNLLVKLKEIKLWCPQKFASQKFSLVAICKSSSIQNFKKLQVFCLAKLLTVLQYKF